VGRPTPVKGTEIVGDERGPWRIGRVCEVIRP
jgi:hypothetical protein